MPRRGNKGTLKNRAQRARENKYTRKERRKEGVKSKKEFEEFITYKTIEAGYAAAEAKHILEDMDVRTSKGGSIFDADLNLPEILKLQDGLAKHTTQPREVELISGRTILAKGLTHMKARDVILLSLLVYIPLAGAKWNNWSATPGELSAWDTISSAAATGATISGFLTDFYPPAAPIAGGLKLLSHSTKLAGTLHRVIDHGTGKYEMESRDLAFTMVTGTLQSMPIVADITKVGTGYEIPNSVVKAASMFGTGREKYAAAFPRTAALTPSVARKNKSVIPAALKTTVKGAFSKIKDVTGITVHPENEKDLFNT